jgi:hypothetical protein
MKTGGIRDEYLYPCRGVAHTAPARSAQLLTTHNHDARAIRDGCSRGDDGVSGRGEDVGESFGECGGGEEVATVAAGERQ